ncbi:MAG TPA: hypothetical protein VN813_08600 [Luteibacter sp.]|nr:hypothetical protein [Luteibacter sp.]
MSLFVVAGFVNQFAAASVVDKLLSRGVHRDRIATTVDRCFAMPTPVVAELEKLAPHAEEGSRLTPADAGHVMVAVEVDDEMSEDDLCWFLETSGAECLSVLDENIADNAAVPSSQEHSRLSIDVERAICATRRGEPLGPHSRQ